LIHFEVANPPIGTLFALLLPSGLVANGGSQVNTGSIGQLALGTAEEHSQAALLQDVHIVVVGVAHGPTAGMFPGLIALDGIDEPAVSVGPIVKVVELPHRRHLGVVDVPVEGQAGFGGRRTGHGHGNWYGHRHIDGHAV